MAAIPTAATRQPCWLKLVYFSREKRSLVRKYAMPVLIARLSQDRSVSVLSSSDGPTAFRLGQMVPSLHAPSSPVGLGQSRSGCWKFVGLRWIIPTCAQIVVVAAVAVCIPVAGWAQCNEDAATHCETTMSHCRANCDRAFHREEANQDCRLECQSHYSTCRADARCKAGQ